MLVGEMCVLGINKDFLRKKNSNTYMYMAWHLNCIKFLLFENSLIGFCSLCNVFSYFLASNFYYKILFFSFLLYVVFQHSPQRKFLVTKSTCPWQSKNCYEMQFMSFFFFFIFYKIKIVCIYLCYSFICEPFY